ncbi:MAG: Rpp14/Pop5 family protein [archaeon]
MQVQKKSTKALPASWRIKKRYLKFQIVSENKFSQRDVNYSLIGHLLSLLGSLHFAEMHFSLVLYDPESGLGILRCSRDSLQTLKAGLVLLSHVNNIKVSVRLLKTSGTIKSLKTG